MKLIVNIIVTILMWSPQVVSAVCVQGECTNGHGTDIQLDGSKYVGEFSEGVRNGKGSMTYPDGTTYVGNWQNDNFHGKGTLVSVGKFEHTGEFANGVRHGQGTLKKVDGITYVGQWANDLPNGQGVKTLADGMQYSGEFKNGLMYGSGTLVMPDGSKLKIKWNNAHSLQKDWHMTATPGKTQKLFSQEPQQSPRHMEVSSRDLIAGDETPSDELDQSAVTPEQVAPQASKVDVVTVKDNVQTEAISESRLAEEEKTISEAVTPVGKQDGPEPKVIFPQNIETTSTVEYASIAVGANIRSQASLTSEVLRSVPPGYPVGVLEKQADWLLVGDYRGRKGWVYASLVTKPGTVIIKVFKGNLRRGPSLKDDIIVQLDHGTIMSVLERNGEWLKVSDFEELTGWLHHKVIWPAAENE
jgi:SH3-like domain-containing protein